MRAARRAGWTAEGRQSARWAGVEVGGQGEVEVEGEEELQLQRVELGQRQATDLRPVINSIRGALPFEKRVKIRLVAVLCADNDGLKKHPSREAAVMRTRSHCGNNTHPPST